MDYDAERTRLLEKHRTDMKRETRSDVANTLAVMAAGAALAWWAYGTVAHAVLFSFVVYAISGVGNRVCSEIRRGRAIDDIRRVDEIKNRSDAAF